MFKKVGIILVALFGLYNTAVFAQEFAEKSMTFSYKKLAYVYLENGDSVIGIISKVGYKKGLVDEIKIKKEGEKKAIEVEINKIKMAYLPLPNLIIASQKIGTVSNANKWEKTGINEKLMKDGYVLYEKTVTVLKGKEEILLLQLINPAFCDKIRVYSDPYAAQSQSFGVGGINLAGGDDLAYYIKVGTQSAMEVKRKDFKDNISNFFGDCPSLEARLKDKSDWTDLAKYILEHSNCN
jgi:hypothetical protein